MKVEVVMPQMGESIAEGTIVRWTKKVGDTVTKDENILEISTDKVDSEIPSPAAGRLVELRAQEGETVPVGSVIAVLETEAAADGAEPSKPVQEPPEAKVPEPQRDDQPQPERAHEREERAEAGEEEDASKGAPSRAKEALAPAGAEPPPAEPAGRGIEDRFYSPLVRSIARSEGISTEELSRIQGRGRGGRVTRDDLLQYLEERKRGGTRRDEGRAAGDDAAARRAVGAPGGDGDSGGRAPAPATTTSAAAPPPAGARDFEPYPKYKVSETRTTNEGPVDVVVMDTMRQRIAEHMVRSKATSPHVASVTEVDMTGIVRFRQARMADFQARYGFKLTYTPFIVAAAVRALVDYPMVNSSVDGTTILLKRFVNIGVAVALDNGLIVPVVKRAEEKNFFGIARAIQDLATRARSKKLLPDDVQGVTFAVTNMGGFGNLFGIPIINQPATGILGAGAIVKRPVIVDDAIAVRDVMYLSLSYDHRVIDGALGGRFIQRVRHYLEKTDLAGGV